MLFTKETLKLMSRFEDLSGLQQDRLNTNLDAMHTQVNGWHDFFTLVRTSTQLRDDRFLYRLQQYMTRAYSALDQFGAPDPLVVAWKAANCQLLTMIDITQGNEPVAVATRQFWGDIHLNFPWIEQNALYEHIARLRVPGRSISNQEGAKSVRNVLEIAALSFLWALNTEQAFSGINLYLAILNLYNLGAVEVYAGHDRDYRQAMIAEFAVQTDKDVRHICIPVDNPAAMDPANWTDHPKHKCPNFFFECFPKKSKYDLNED